MFKGRIFSKLIAAWVFSVGVTLTALTASTTAVAQEQGSGPIKIVVASVPLVPGEAVTQDKLRYVDWPSSSVPEGAFTSIDQLAPAGYAHLVARPVGADEPILASELLPEVVATSANSDNLAALDKVANASVNGSGDPTSAEPTPDSAVVDDGQSSDQARKAILIGLISAVLSSLLAGLVYSLIAGSAPISRARKYAAVASISGIAVHMKLIGGFILGTFSDKAVASIIGLSIDAVIFVVLAYFIGRYKDKRAANATNALRNDIGVNSETRGTVSSTISDPAIAVQSQRKALDSVTMNDSQRKIVMIGLISIAAALAITFMRIGAVSDYRNAILILRLSEISNPNAGYPYQPLTVGWGLIARMGLAGVLCGIVLPMALGFAAFFIGQGTKHRG